RRAGPRRAEFRRAEYGDAEARLAGAGPVETRAERPGADKAVMRAPSSARRGVLHRAALCYGGSP
ncbi:hypothetical protein, partial [Acidiphilium sp. PM]|uniref:hypothetical protein n=1 Tax=Acidiphilium sp. PM TaxID=1043206 RepID=UPI00058698CF